MARPEPILVQAPVKALDEDGVSIALIGTAGFIAATLVGWINGEALAGTGHLWWLWVAVTGAGIGVAFSVFCLIRRARRVRQSNQHDAET